MRKNKILLVNPPYNLPERNPNSGVSLGLGYISSFLKASGFEATILDTNWVLCNIFKRPVEYVMYDTHLNNFYKNNGGTNDNKSDKTCLCRIGDVIRKVSPDILGLSITSPAHNSALRIASIAKEINPAITVVAGGIHPTVTPTETLKEPAFDIVVIGEGEHTMLDLAKCLPDKKSLYAIPGIAFKNEKGDIIFTKSGDLVEDLDTFYFPDRTFLSLRGRVEVKKDGGIITSRGCCFKCTFCSRHSIRGRNIRYRTAENVIEEIIYLKSKYKINRFAFHDDIFGFNHSQIEKICNILLCKKIKIKWDCQTRVGILNSNLLRLMEKAGCWKIDIGVESGNEKILEKIKKDIPVSEILESAHIIKQSGIKLQCNFIIGYPEETEDTLLDTKKLIDKIKPDYLSLSFLIPYPGSQIFCDLSKENRIKTYNWSLYSYCNPDLFIRDGILCEKLLLYRSIILRDFIKTMLTKLLDIKYLISETVIVIKNPILLIEKVKKLIFFIFQMFVTRS